MYGRGAILGSMSAAKGKIAISKAIAEILADNDSQYVTWGCKTRLAKSC